MVANIPDSCRFPESLRRAMKERALSEGLTFSELLRAICRASMRDWALKNKRVTDDSAITPDVDPDARKPS